MNSEIILIGTGGGYGESILIHLKENHWIVIDSCIDPHTKTSLPLDYLKERDVDLENDVKLIICTHWHDDHIRGLYNLFKECSRAKLSFASCHDVNKFLLFVGLDFEKNTRGTANSSTTEFSLCLKLANERGTPVIRAVQDRLLYKHANCFIYSLSPSDFTLENYDKEVSTLITEHGSPSNKVVSSSPNSKSIALYVKLGEHSAILGGDLEVSRDNREGWINIIENCSVIENKSSYFKIPHHGSETAYHPEIWNILLTENPNCNLTPWNRNTKLPQIDMLKKMQTHTDCLHITSGTIGTKAKKRDRSIEKFIKAIKPSVQEIKFNKGVIRCIIDNTDPNKTWVTKLSGSAKHVDHYIKEFESQNNIS